MNYDHLKTRLEAEAAELVVQLASHGVENGGDWSGGNDHLEVDRADRNEVADQIEEMVTNTPIVEELEHRYHLVMHALSKFEKGGYGICEVCKTELPPERLEADPAARTKVACAGQEAALV
jgi:DnaK suppressor protein